KRFSGGGCRGPRSLTPPLRPLTPRLPASRLGTTRARLGLVFLAGPALARLIEPFFGGIAVAWRGTATHSVATLLAFMLITYLDVVCGGLVPKTLALQSPDRVAPHLAGPLNIFARLSRPLLLLRNRPG